jgi:membrane protein DedA with SNARE-associated domain
LFPYVLAATTGAMLGECGGYPVGRLLGEHR